MNTITTEAYFNNIKQKLIDELGLAEKTIYAAVAWFTDRELLAALYQKQQAGVRVALAITNDHINKNLSFNSLEAAGGLIYRIDGALMHNKFCIIDNRDVITGSYNWTYRAASENYENIIITAGDYDLAYRYLIEFNRITGNKILQTGFGPDLAKVIRRLEVIRSLVQLEEHEDIMHQARRLMAEWSDPLAVSIYEHLKAGQYTTALETIGEFTKLHSRITIYEDPFVSALKLEIRDLEYRLIAVEAEIIDAEKLLSDYNHEFTIRLGALTEDILLLKKDYAHRHRQQSQYSQFEYEEAQNRYERFKQDRQEEQQKTFYPLDAAGRFQLKRIHRYCVMLCHPDKVAEELQADATELFRQVQECYEQQDLARLESLAAQLTQGILHTSATASNNLVQLKLRKDRLLKQVEKALLNLDDLRISAAYLKISAITDLEQHFQELYEQLTQELMRWQSYVTEPASA